MAGGMDMTTGVLRTLLSSTHLDGVRETTGNYRHLEVMCGDVVTVVCWNLCCNNHFLSVLRRNPTNAQFCIVRLNKDDVNVVILLQSNHGMAGRDI